MSALPTTDRRGATVPDGWPINRNHEAARRHVDQVLRDNGRGPLRRETEIAQLLDEMLRERDALRAAMSAKSRA